MLNPSHARRIAVLGALACTLLAATTATAAQRNDDAHCRVQLGAGLPFVPCPHPPGTQNQPTSTAAAESSRLNAARAQERYYARGETEPPDPRLTWAQAQERYYSSYGQPEPIIAPLAPAHPDDTPWLMIALAAATALAAAVIAAIHRRRLRLRRRVARAVI